MESVKTVAGGIPRSALLPLALLAGCTGVVSGASGSPGGPRGSGASGATSGTGSSSGSAGGSPVVVAPASPGVLVARRLNRIEYSNTVIDLLGTTLKTADDFPADDLGGEFATVGSALSLSPTHVMAYEKSAHALVADLFAAPAARQQRIITCNVETGGDACAQTILGSFARRAWRRPVTGEELQGLLLPMTIARMVGATPTDGLKNALAAVLLSPFFIFKLEIDPDPTSAQPRRLNAYELATRLSYSLWSTMPDDVLSAAADAGQLSTDAQLSAQIDRMLADARAGALLDNFTAEWLDFNDLESHEVQTTSFPRYTPALLQSMRLEARRFFEEFLRTDHPVTELLSARYTFLDATLAGYYGLPRSAAGAAATDFVRVDTTAAPRAGLLTLGALLTTTSLPSRTSPVKRGQFVFTRLLCGTIAAPPPDVPPLPEDTGSGLTLRQRTEQHRQDPACSPCHAVMDPIGFGLENYDALGAYRSSDGTGPIDATGTLPDGKMFDGAVDLGTALSGDPRFIKCVTNKFMTFAVGRLLNQRDDATWVSYLANRASTANGSLSNVMRAVLMSESFRSRQPAGL